MTAARVLMVGIHLAGAILGLMLADMAFTAVIPPG